MPNNAGGNGEGTNKQAREPPIDEQFSAKECSKSRFEVGQNETMRRQSALQCRVPSWYYKESVEMSPKIIPTLL
jgi:hypothetical protein